VRERALSVETTSGGRHVALEAGAIQRGDGTKRNAYQWFTRSQTATSRPASRTW
jgi:hypothetical protein